MRSALQLGWAVTYPVWFWFNIIFALADGNDDNSDDYFGGGGKVTVTKKQSTGNLSEQDSPSETIPLADLVCLPSSYKLCYDLAGMQ